jgi:uncharacterized phosphosugar-binding protein
MPTLAEQLPAEIARLEKKFGSDNRFVTMLKQQLNAIQQGKSTKQLYQMGARQRPDTVLDLQNLPFDPAQAAGEASLLESDRKERERSAESTTAKPKQKD